MEAGGTNDGSIYGMKTKGMEERRSVSFSTGKFASRLFNATHPFLVPKEQQDIRRKKRGKMVSAAFLFLFGLEIFLSFFFLDL